MKVKELKELLNNLPDNDLIVATEGNTSPDYTIVGVEDSTMCGVWEIRITNDD